ncbi:MAG: ferredoxin [Ignavibacteria bacterium]|nr:ferredoxin [Ignavibacteria bacterium]
MELIFEGKTRAEFVKRGAKQMMAAARTAPKGRGADNLVIAIAEKETIKKISEHQKIFAEKNNAAQFFYRDAENILSAEILFLIGTKYKPASVSPCGMCGFKDCEENEQNPGHPCVLNVTDLGIAIGSAVSVASQLHIDNRIMYSVGQTVLDLKLLGDDVKIAYGIPLSVSSKNPFFDRRPK